MSDELTFALKNKRCRQCNWWLHMVEQMQFAIVFKGSEVSPMQLATAYGVSNIISNFV